MDADFAVADGQEKVCVGHRPNIAARHPKFYPPNGSFSRRGGVAEGSA
jgi:hypothetical protein